MGRKRLYESFGSNELTEREKEIINAICVKGLFYEKEVADFFNLSPTTIRTHRRNIFSKLDVHSVYELIFWYYTKRNTNEIQLHTFKK